MVPLWILKLSCSTLATGARQFVVQEALDTMLCLAGSYLSSFTPRTMVMSSFFAGAEMITFFTGPRRCFFGLLRLSEFARGLDHHLRAHGFPVDGRRVFL